MGSVMCLIFSKLAMPPTPDAIITVHLTVYSDRVWETPLPTDEPYKFTTE